MAIDPQTIIVGSDHAGFDLKEFVKEQLKSRGIPFVDAGAARIEAQDDYPVYASKVAGAVSEGLYRRGISLCGTGIGASITANRFRGVRAALCANPDMARMSRLHNDSNVLVLGGRTTSREEAVRILDAWLSTQPESGGGRHGRRIEQMDHTEEIYRSQKR